MNLKKNLSKIIPFYKDKLKEQDKYQTLTEELPALVEETVITLTPEEQMAFASLDENLDRIFSLFPRHIPYALKNFDRYLQEGDKKLVTDANLIINLQDADFVSKYISSHYKIINQHDSLAKASDKIDIATILKYVNTSPKFAEKRNELEQIIVNNYIEIHKQGENDFAFNHEVLKSKDTSPIYDEMFRDDVVAAMSSIGLQADNIQTALELNREQWLPDARRIAFKNCQDNQIDKVQSIFLQTNPALAEEYRHAVVEYFNQWNQMKDCQYYLVNQAVIEKTDTVTPGMKISQAKKNQLQINLKLAEEKCNDMAAQAYRLLHTQEHNL